MESSGDYAGQGPCVIDIHVKQRTVVSPTSCSQTDIFKVPFLLHLLVVRIPTPKYNKTVAPKLGIAQIMNEGFESGIYIRLHLFFNLSNKLSTLLRFIPFPTAKKEHFTLSLFLFSGWIS